MALGFEFCLSKSSKASKQRSAAQHQINRKSNCNTTDNFQANNNGNSIGVNGSNRNSQHSLNHRDHHTTPTTSTTTTTTTAPNGSQTLPKHADAENNINHNFHTNSHLFMAGIRHVSYKYCAGEQDELSVSPGDICVLEYSVNDEQGKSWSHVLCLTQKNARGFVPSEVLTTQMPEYLPQYKKKTHRSYHTDHSRLMQHQLRNSRGNHIEDCDPRAHHHQQQQQHLHHQHLQQQQHQGQQQQLHHHHHHHHHPSNHHHNHGPLHTSGVAPTVIGNHPVGLISRGIVQCDVGKIGGCTSDRTCPSNGDSIRSPSTHHVDIQGAAMISGAPPDQQARLDTHPSLLQGAGAAGGGGAGTLACQAFQKYPPEPEFTDRYDPASYYNLDGHVPEPPYESGRVKCTPFRRDYPGELYVVMFNFVHREEGDIGVRPGDYVCVLNKDDEDWYWVRREEDGLEGFVPSRFIVANDKAESILNKGNSTVTMKSSNAIDLHTYINSNPKNDRVSLVTDQQSLLGP